ncbi:ComF family protein [Hydrogenimonas sp.]
MRCHSCRRLGLSVLCRECRRLHLTPRPQVRRLESGLSVTSFYAYGEIEPLLLTKHTPQGWWIYRILAREAFGRLPPPSAECFVLPVDDDASSGYSHTAILAREIARRGYRPLFGRLRAQNRISYAGKPLAFRLANPREFRYSGPEKVSLVLVDDIVTTGLTLKEAHSRLLGRGIDVREAFVLADVDR